jgi:hypothetical protein
VLVGDDTAVPFFQLDSDEPAEVVLRQTSASAFRIDRPFRYVDSATGEEFRVPTEAAVGDETDLASVPSILLWFVPRYGLHTLPALLHDQLVDHDLADDRERADRIFRDAMGEQGVLLARRWVMWSAVSIATIVKGRTWLIVPVAVWLLAFAALAFRLTPPFAAWDVWPFNVLVDVPWWGAALGAALGPAVLAVTWGRRYLAGVISGYGAFFLAVPIVAIVIALGVYWAFEGPLRVLGRRRPQAPVDQAEVVVRSQAGTAAR